MKKQTKSNISPNFFDFEFFYENVTRSTVKVKSHKTLDISGLSGKFLIETSNHVIKPKS